MDQLEASFTSKWPFSEPLIDTVDFSEILSSSPGLAMFLSSTQSATGYKPIETLSLWIIVDCESPYLNTESGFKTVQ